MSRLGRSLALALVTAASVSAAGAAFADQAFIDYRKAVYQAIGGHTKGLAAIVKGEVPFTDSAQAHADALAAAAEMTVQLFPAGSGDGDTRALPVIWEKNDAFKKTQEAFVTAAAAVAKAAESDVKQVGAALGELAKTCKACHDDFRKDVK